MSRISDLLTYSATVLDRAWIDYAKSPSTDTGTAYCGRAFNWAASASEALQADGAETDPGYARLGTEYDAVNTKMNSVFNAGYAQRGGDFSQFASELPGAFVKEVRDVGSGITAIRDKVLGLEYDPATGQKRATGNPFGIEPSSYVYMALGGLLAVFLISRLLR